MAIKIIPISEFNGTTPWVNGNIVSVNIVGDRVYITYIPNIGSDSSNTPVTEPVNTSSSDTGDSSPSGWNPGDDLKAIVDENSDIVIINDTIGDSFNSGNINNHVITNEQDTVFISTGFNMIHFQLFNLGDFELSNRSKNPKTIEHDGFLYMLDNIKYTDSNEFWVSLVRYEIDSGLCSVVNIGKDLLSQFNEFDNDEYFQNNYFDVFIANNNVYLIMETPQLSISPYIEGTYLIFMMDGTSIVLHGIYHSNNYLNEQPIIVNNHFYFKNGAMFDFPNNAYTTHVVPVYNNGITYYGNNGVLITLYNNEVFIKEFFEQPFLEKDIADDAGVEIPCNCYQAVGVNRQWLFKFYSTLDRYEVNQVFIEIFKRNGDYLELYQTITLTSSTPMDGSCIKAVNEDYFLLYMSSTVYGYLKIYLFRFNHTISEWQQVDLPDHYIPTTYVSYSPHISMADLYQASSGSYLFAVYSHESDTNSRIYIYEYDGANSFDLIFDIYFNTDDGFGFGFYNDSTLILYTSDTTTGTMLGGTSYSAPYLHMIDFKNNNVTDFEIPPMYNADYYMGRNMPMQVYGNYIFLPGNSVSTSVFSYVLYFNSGNLMHVGDIIPPYARDLTNKINTFSYLYRIKNNTLVGVYPIFDDSGSSVSTFFVYHLGDIDSPGLFFYKICPLNINEAIIFDFYNEEVFYNGFDAPVPM